MDVRKRIVHGATSARENVPAGSRYRSPTCALMHACRAGWPASFQPNAGCYKDDVCTRSRPSVHI